MTALNKERRNLKAKESDNRPSIISADSGSEPASILSNITMVA